VIGQRLFEVTKRLLYADLMLFDTVFEVSVTLLKIHGVGPFGTVKVAWSQGVTSMTYGTLIGSAPYCGNSCKVNRITDGLLVEVTLTAKQSVI
jgi:hypothetical protein